MDINISIPSRYDRRNFWLFAGIDPVAYKLIKEPWKVKTSDCSMCGKCCMTLKDDKMPFTITNGICEHLERRPGKDECYLCAFNIMRPFACCIGLRPVEECTVRFEEFR